MKTRLRDENIIRMQLVCDNLKQMNCKTLVEISEPWESKDKELK